MATKNRIAREKAMIGDMIMMYCRRQHQAKRGTLCADCAALRTYALARLDCCKFGEEKSFCSQCPVHCYRKDMREKIRQVMRYAGPRSLLRHPIAACLHAAATMEQLKKQRRKAE